MDRKRCYNRVTEDIRVKLIQLVFFQESFTIKQAAFLLGIKYDNAKKICRRYDL